MACTSAKIAKIVAFCAWLKWRPPGSSACAMYSGRTVRTP
ncbi:hypothetical protein BH11MYX4_BH11MYX4_14950 [soil metagenome]